MTSTRRRAVTWAATALVAGWAPGLGAAWQAPTSRLVVVFGVLATPGDPSMDPKIAPVVQAQLRRALPGHGFKLVGKVQSRRVVPGESVSCVLGDGFAASATLMIPLDPVGKVQLRYELTQSEISQFQSIVATPPDQFNFFDKVLPGGSHLLVGVGAR